MNMSLRRFSGWAPVTEIHHEYDSDGRLIRSAEWTESEWSAQEQGWMLALDEYERGLCSGCGGDVAETFDPDSQFGYDVSPPHRCHRCTALSQAAKAFAAQGGEHMHALRFVATRR